MNKKQIAIFSLLAVAIFALGVYAANAEPISLRIGNTSISFLPLVLGTDAAYEGEAYIQAGTFQMGCFDFFNQDQVGCTLADELPLHPVWLDSYYIDKWEVTNFQQ